MKEFRADIHCHTICSDGSDHPEHLLQLAKNVGLQGISITDHDTISAYTSEFFVCAQKLDIRVLNGVEISSEENDHSVHILGYGFDLGLLGTFLHEMQQRRKERNRAILEKINQKGMPIREEEIQVQGTMGRPHIAQVMVRKGYVATMQEAFEKYLREGAPCFAPGFKCTPKEVIEQIHKAKGKAVLAHPHFLKKGSFLRHLLGLDFDGIECYYGKLPKELERPWLKIAEERGMIATGGSDYHGAFKPHIDLGCSWVNEHVFKQLQALL